MDLSRFYELVVSRPEWSFSLTLYRAEGEGLGSETDYYELTLFQEGECVFVDDVDVGDLTELLGEAAQKIQDCS